PPSFPPTQPVIVLPPPSHSSQPRMAPLQQETMSETYNERPGIIPMRPDEELPHAKLNPPHDLSRHMENRGVRQVIAMIIGLALYTGVYYFISYLSLQHKDFASYALFSLSVVIPLFFGAV